MPDYKHRRIELTPIRHTDGTWHCPYRIIEFRQTCWRYHKGCTDGSFASREEAATAALEEAKRIVDSLKLPPLSRRGSVRGTYREGMTRLTFYFVRSFVYIGNMVGRSMFFLPKYRTIANTFKVSTWSRR